MKPLNLATCEEVGRRTLAQPDVQGESSMTGLKEALRRIECDEDWRTITAALAEQEAEIATYMMIATEDAQEVDRRGVRIKGLEAEIARLRADAARKRHAGAMLANCAFNLAQRKHLTDEERRSLDLSRSAWDAAIAATGKGDE